MTDKELRKLNKSELLWLLRDQEEEIRELKERLAERETPSAEPPQSDDVRSEDLQ